MTRSNSSTETPMPPTPSGVTFADDVTKTVGETPLVRLRHLPLEAGVEATILAKLEFFNPSGSVKDRMVVYALDEAVRRGDLKPGGTIVEGTSGNTGAAIAMYAAANGYRAIITIADKMSQEKIDGLRAYGAEVHICPTAVPPDSPEYYAVKARHIAEQTPNSFFLGQFWNMDNIEAHYRSTGPEIWRQTGGKLNALVGGIGTGGTMSGSARFLKEQNAEVRIVGADPKGSIFYDKFNHDKEVEGQPYLVEGIGDDFFCPTLDMKVFDEVLQVDDRKAFLTARDLTRKEGIFAGGSAGATVAVALRYAKGLPAGQIVVVILPDGGARYVSKIYNDTWMREKGFID